MHSATLFANLCKDFFDFTPNDSELKSDDLHQDFKYKPETASLILQQLNHHQTTQTCLSNEIPQQQEDQSLEYELLYHFKPIEYFDANLKVPKIIPSLEDEFDELVKNMKYTPIIRIILHLITKSVTNRYILNAYYGTTLIPKLKNQLAKDHCKYRFALLIEIISADCKPFKLFNYQEQSLSKLDFYALLELSKVDPLNSYVLLKSCSFCFSTKLHNGENTVVSKIKFLNIKTPIRVFSFHDTSLRYGSEVCIDVSESGIQIYEDSHASFYEYEFLDNKSYTFTFLFDDRAKKLSLYIDLEEICSFNMLIHTHGVSTTLGHENNTGLLLLFDIKFFKTLLPKSYISLYANHKTNYKTQAALYDLPKNSKRNFLVPSSHHTAAEIFNSNEDAIDLSMGRRSDKQMMYFSLFRIPHCLLNWGLFPHVIYRFHCASAKELFQELLPLFLNKTLSNSYMEQRFREFDGYLTLTHLIMVKIRDYTNKTEVVNDLFKALSGQDNEVILNENLFTQLVLPILRWPNADEKVVNTFLLKLHFFFTDSNRYSAHNIQVLENENTVSLILESLSLHEENFEHFKNPFTECMTSILSNPFAEKSFNILFFFTYHKLKFQEHSALAFSVLSILDNVFCRALDTLNKPLFQMIKKCWSLKYLLMLFNASFQSKCFLEAPLYCVSLLLRFLELDENDKLFFQNDAFAVMFAIIRRLDPTLKVKVVQMLYVASFETNLQGKTFPFSDDFNKLENGFVREQTELHLLALKIISFEIVQHEFCSAAYIDAISQLAGNSQKYRTFLQKEDARVLIALIKLLRLMKNAETKVRLELLLASIMIDGLASLSNSELVIFFKHLNFSISLAVPVTTKSTKCTILVNIIPKIVERLTQFESSFQIFCWENKDFVKNLLYLFQVVDENILLLDWDLKFLMDVLKVSMVIIEFKKNEWTSSHKELKFMYNLVSHCLLSSIKAAQRLPSPPNVIEFFKLLLTYQETLFSKNNGARVTDTVFVPLLSFIVCFSATENVSDPYSVTSFRTILMHKEPELKELSKQFCRNCKAFPKDFLECSLTANDDELFKMFKAQQSLFAKALDADLQAKRRHSVTRFEQAKCLLEMEKEATIYQENFIKKDIQYSDQVYELFKKDIAPFEAKALYAERRRQSSIKDDQEEFFQYYWQKILNIEYDITTMYKLYGAQKPSENWQRYVLSASSTELLKKTLGLEFKRNSLQMESFYDVIAPCANSETFKASSAQVENADMVETTSNLQTSEHTLNIPNENRKVLKNLLPEETISQIWNSSMVIGLHIEEGVFILGEKSCYFITNFFYSKAGKKIIELSKANADERDDIIQLVSGENNTSFPNESYSGKEKLHEVTKFAVNEIACVAKRPFLFQDQAAVVIVQSRKSFFFSFDSSSSRDSFYRKLSQIQNPSILEDKVLDLVFKHINSQNETTTVRNGISSGSFTWKLTNAVQSLAESSLLESITEMWRQRKISNFFYLIIINLFAGRSFNDLTQYPVFPWIIKDYHTNNIDLSNPASFRDLSKPMGAQSIRRANEFIERFEALEELNDPSITPFHYGTHYSSAMIVASYLIRVEPYTASYFILQGNKLGPSDRLFNSIERAWKSASAEISTDVRELVPEFYYLPEFLVNVNNRDFGTLQDGSKVDFVELPAWAKNDPMIFVRTNREALESDYVSDHLHEWIDLVFGFKQKGQEAVKAVNVFNELSYSGAVKLDNIRDRREKQTLTSIIHNFGQTPLQIFETPHKQRSNGPTEPQTLLAGSTCKVNTAATIRNRLCAKYLFPRLINDTSAARVFFELNIDENAKSKFKENKFWLNGVLGVSNEISFKALVKIRANVFATGDELGGIIVWNLEKGIAVAQQTLCGHLYSIMDMDVSPENNVMISLDTSGKLLQWDLSSGGIIAGMEKSASIKNIAISNASGNVAISKNCSVTLLNINRRQYLTADLPYMPTAINFCDEGVLTHAFSSFIDILIFGYENGIVEVYALTLEASCWQLRLVQKYQTEESSAIEAVGGSKTEDLKKNNVLLKISAMDANGKMYTWV
ncbi:hypothetical protein ACO0RG_001768 [Hanseniaspora osmophila]